MCNLLKCSAEQFRLRITGDLAETLVDKKEFALERDLRHADRGLLECSAETFFCFATHLFRTCPCGNVFHEKDNATDVSRRLEPRTDFPFRPTDGAIGPV